MLEKLGGYDRNGWVVFTGICTEERVIRANELKNTFWRLIKSVDGDTDYLKMYPEYRNAIVTFTDEHASKYVYRAKCDLCTQNEILWLITSDGRLQLTAPGSAKEAVRFTSVCGFAGSPYEITSNTLTARFSYESGGEHVVVYQKVDSSSSADNNNGSNGNPSSDKSDFYETNFDFTATTSSITVKFYFSDKVESGSISYGTASSSCTHNPGRPSIAGTCAMITISGLKPSTKYYFKCRAKAKGGSSYYTTPAYPAITN